VALGAAFFPPHNDLSHGEDRCAAEKMLVGEQEESYPLRCAESKTVAARMPPSTVAVRGP